MECKNYCTIPILSVSGKVFASIVLGCVKDFLHRRWAKWIYSRTGFSYWTGSFRPSKTTNSHCGSHLTSWIERHSGIYSVASHLMHALHLELFANLRQRNMILTPDLSAALMDKIMEPTAHCGLLGATIGWEVCIIVVYVNNVYTDVRSAIPGSGVMNRRTNHLD